jgi:hypothetical protein
MPPVTASFRSGRALRPAVAGLWAAALALQLGCYSYLPVQSAPPVAVGKDVAVVLNDRGRALLAERVGPAIDRIDGRLAGVEGDAVTVAVTRVTDLRGNSAGWSGEPVRIPRDAITGFRPRTFSTFKTALLAGAVVLGVVLSLRTSLDIFGTPEPDRPDGGPQKS